MPSPKRNGTPERALGIAGNRLTEKGYLVPAAILAQVSKWIRSSVNQQKLKEVQNRKNRASSLIARSRYLKTVPVANLTRNNRELLQYVNHLTRVNRGKAFSKNVNFNGLERYYHPVQLPSYQPSNYYLNRARMLRMVPNDPHVNAPRAYQPIVPAPGHYYKSTGKRTSGKTTMMNHLGPAYVQHLRNLNAQRTAARVVKKWKKLLEK